MLVKYYFKQNKTTDRKKRFEEPLNKVGIKNIRKSLCINILFWVMELDSMELLEISNEKVLKYSCIISKMNVRLLIELNMRIRWDYRRIFLCEQTSIFSSLFLPNKSKLIHLYCFSLQNSHIFFIFFILFLCVIVWFYNLWTCLLH